MKVTNWRRSLAASLVAGGLMSPSAAYAANLNTNLVLNPSFENVDLTNTCCYGSTAILNWTDGTQTGFAYNYNQGYDAGGPLAGGGNYYFSPNSNPAGFDDVTALGRSLRISMFRPELLPLKLLAVRPPSASARSSLVTRPTATLVISTSSFSTPAERLLVPRKFQQRIRPPGIKSLAWHFCRSARQS